MYVNIERDTLVVSLLGTFIKLIKTVFNSNVAKAVRLNKCQIIN